MQNLLSADQMLALLIVSVLSYSVIYKGHLWQQTGNFFY